MNNKYFTPSIEDLHVGKFDFEINHFDSQWMKMDYLSSYHLPEIDSGQADVRVPYLTQQQIEGEGWEYDKSQILDIEGIFCKNIIYRKEKMLVSLYYNFISNWLLVFSGNHIKTIWENKTQIQTNNTLFAGNCKSINEFRQIQKLLGI